MRRDELLVPAAQGAERPELADEGDERLGCFQSFGLRGCGAGLLLVHRFVFIERLLDEGMAVAAEPNEGLVQLIGLVGVERKLRLRQLELRVVVCGPRAVLAGGHYGLFSLDAVVQRVQPLGDLQCLAGKGRSMLGGTAQGAGERLIDLAIRQTQRILCILALLGHGCLRGQLAGHAQRRLVYQPAGGRQSGGSIEFQGWIPANCQMLADEQRYEEQRQDAEQAKAAKVTKLGGREDGGAGSCLVRAAGRARVPWDGPFWIVPSWIVMKATESAAQSKPH